MNTMLMYNKKEECYDNFLGKLTQMEFSSHLRLGDYWKTTFYFRDGSEYTITVRDGKTTTETTGLAAWIYRKGCWLKSRLFK